MGLSKKHLQGLATGFQLGGVIVTSLDSDNQGIDDKLGKGFQTAGIALAQLAAGESVSKKAKAADAIDAIVAGLQGVSSELRGEG
jgi:hypothetical protein